MSAVRDRMLQFAPAFQYLVVTKWQTQEPEAAAGLVIPLTLKFVVHLLKFCLGGGVIIKSDSSDT
jgi:hypothetical protein